MKLARDEVAGLIVAGAVGAAAIATFAYRSTWPAVPAEPEPPPAAVAEPAAPRPVGSQDARDAFADRLHQAFAEDGIDAAAAAQGTELHVRWFKCSRQMVKQLLDRKDDALTRTLRQTSGLSLERLRADGFTRLVCDNTRGQIAAETIR